MKHKNKLFKLISSVLTLVAVLGANTRCLVFVHEPKKPVSLDKYKFTK
ncbi:cyclic lactone autoinducer peptide [Enterococcus casseliflavus]